MSPRFSAALLATTLLASPALAGLPAPVDGWRTGAMRTAAGEFSYCVTEARYTNGLWLILAFNPKEGINLGVGMPGAQMTVGAEMPVTVLIEGFPAQTVKGRPTKPELLVVSAGDNQSLLDALSNSKSLTVDGNSFALTGSGRAIADLRDCVASGGGPAAPQAQAQTQTQAPQVEMAEAGPQVRFGADESALPGRPGQAPSPFAPPPSQSQPQIVALATPSTSESLDPSPTAEVATVLGQAELTRNTAEPLASPVMPVPPGSSPAPVAPPVIQAQPAKPLPAQLKHLLEVAGVKDVTPVAEPGSAFAWNSRGMTGRVVEVSVAPGSDLSQLAANHLVAIGGHCTGEFAPDVGTVEISGAMTLLTASATCRGAGKPVYTTYVYALSRQGVLSIISHDLADGHKALADRAQSGLIKALKETQG
jgi:hypothetical protein